MRRVLFLLIILSALVIILWSEQSRRRSAIQVWQPRLEAPPLTSRAATNLDPVASPAVSEQAASRAPLAVDSAPALAVPAFTWAGPALADGSRPIALSPRLLDPSDPIWQQEPVRIQLPLADGTNRVIELDDLRPAGVNGISASGRLSGVERDHVSFGRHGQAIALSVLDPEGGGAWSITTKRAGEYAFSYDTVEELQEVVACPDCEPEQTGPVKAAFNHTFHQAAEPWQPLAASINHDDIIEFALRIFVSPDLVTRRGYDTMAAESLSHIAFMNNAFDGTAGLEQLDVSLLATVVADGFDEQSDYQGDLETFGQLLHDRYGAPITSQKVVRWSNHRNYVGCHDSMLLHDKSFSGIVGLAWVTQTPAVGTGRYSSTTKGSILVAHELGHNFGSGHTSDNTIMSSNSWNTTVFGSSSKDQMVPQFNNFPIGSFILPIPDVTVDGAGSTGPVPYFIAGTEDAISVSVTADSDNEALIADESLVLSGSGKVRYVEGVLQLDAIGDATITLTVTIDGMDYTQDIAVSVLNNSSSVGEIAWTQVQLAVVETVGTAQLEVARIGGAVGPAGVHWSLLPGTAEFGADVVAAEGDVTWEDGESGSRYIGIDIVNDVVYEGDEQLTVKLTGVSGASLGSDQIALWIIDDDVPTRRIEVTSQVGYAWSLAGVLGAEQDAKAVFDGLDPEVSHLLQLDVLNEDN